MVTTKQCSRCKTEKPLSAFPKSGDPASNRKGGVRSRCKACRQETRRKTVPMHRRCLRCKQSKPIASFSTPGLTRPTLCGECRAQGTFLDRRRASKYGLSIPEYKRLVEAQGGVCAICRRPETATTKAGTPKPLSVDHDHDTGEVRGLLCSTCNVGIGMFKDDPSLLRLAAAYLADRNAVLRRW